MSIKRRIYRTLQILLGVIIALPLLAAIVMQIPYVQTYIAREVTGLLSDSIDGDIKVGKIYISLPNKIVLKDLSIVSPTPLGNNDTLVNCHTLYLSVKPAEILGGNIGVGRLILEDGNFNLVMETDSTTNIERIFGGGKEEKENSPIDLRFSADEVRLKDFGFDLVNCRNKDSVILRNGGRTDIINFSDLDLSDINISIRNVKFGDGALTARIRQLSCIDKSGFRLETLSGDVEMADNMVRLTDFTLSDGYTRLVSDLLSFDFSEPGAGKDFLRKVVLTLEMENTVFDLQTIGKITPALENCHQRFLLNGRVSGPIADLDTRGLQVHTGSSHLNIDARLKGLPNTHETIFFARINESSLTTRDIAEIVSEFSGQPPMPFLTGMTPGIPYHLEADISGLLLDFSVKARLGSSLGTIYPDMRLDVAGGSAEGVTISGKVSTENLNTGAYAGTPLIGNLTMDTDLYLNFGKGNMDIRIDGMGIDALDFNGYTLSGISLSGKYDGKIAEAALTSADPALALNISGKADFSREDSLSIQVASQIDNLDLARLNLDRKDSTATIQGQVNADIYTGKDFDIFGNIHLKNIYFTNDERMYLFEHIGYRSIKQGDSFDIELNSPFTHAKYKADAPFSSFLNKIGREFLNDALPSFFSAPAASSRRGTYEFYADIYDTRNLFEILKLNARIAPETSINIQVDSTDRMLGYINSDFISFDSNRIENLFTEIRRDTTLKAHILASDLAVQNIHMQNCDIDVTAHNDRIGLRYTFQNREKERISSSADITLQGDFFRKTKDAPLGISVMLDDSEIYFNDRNWMLPGSSIRYTSDSLVVDNFIIRNRNQSLKLDGRITDNLEDRLNLKLEKFDISIVNSFMSQPLDLGGYLSGSASVNSIKNIPNIILDIKGDSLSFYRKPLGSIYISSEWNEELEILDMSLINTQDRQNKLSVNGYFSPKEKYLNLNCRLDSLNAVIAEPFTTGLFSEMGGSISGQIDMEYTPENGINISSNGTRLNQVGLTVDYIKVPYLIDGEFSIDNRQINLQNATITDRYGKRGTARGGLLHDRFTNLRLDTRIDFNNLNCMNTLESDNPTFYGDVFASGKIDITGPFDDLLLDISATTESNTSFHIPLSSASTASSSGLLKFVNKRDSLFRKNTFRTDTENQKKKSNLAVKLDINANPNAEVMVEINKSTGDILKATGSGNIKIDIDPAENVFDMLGDYTIDQGSYKFVILGITSKDFTLQQGGQINFDGDIMNSRLNASALYKTKASINTLMADTSSVSSRRTIECYINLGGTLAKPDIGFDIKIPDLDPTTKSKIDGILSSEDKIQKQFVSLLVSGSFLPDEQSGIVNNSTLLYANVSEMLSNQLNNVFRQLEIPIDLGLSYQPGESNSKGGGDIFDVAISTQLFNNRVIVNGNIGNGQYDKANTVVGDIDIEVKLNKSGNLRLNIFSHSADQYSNYLDDSQRQGIGIIYQDEFNNFKELFRNIFWSKKKRERYAKEQMELFLKDQNIGSDEIVELQEEEKPEKNGKRRKKDKRQ